MAKIAFGLISALVQADGLKYSHPPSGLPVSSVLTVHAGPLAGFQYITFAGVARLVVGDEHGLENAVVVPAGPPQYVPFPVGL